jgi:hypothetical protein
MGINKVIKIKQRTLENIEVRIEQFLLIINSIDLDISLTSDSSVKPDRVEDGLWNQIQDTAKRINNDIYSDMFVPGTPVYHSLHNAKFNFVKLLAAFYETYDFDWSVAPDNVLSIIDGIDEFAAEGFSFEHFEKAKTALALTSLRLLSVECENATEKTEYIASTLSKYTLKNLSDLLEESTVRLISNTENLLQNANEKDTKILELENLYSILKEELNLNKLTIDNNKTQDKEGTKALVLFVIKIISDSKNPDRFKVAGNKINIDFLTEYLLESFEDKIPFGFGKSTIKGQLKEVIGKHHQLIEESINSYK